MFIYIIFTKWKIQSAWHHTTQQQIQVCSQVMVKVHDCASRVETWMLIQILRSPSQGQASSRAFSRAIFHSLKTFGNCVCTLGVPQDKAFSISSSASLVTNLKWFKLILVPNPVLQVTGSGKVLTHARCVTHSTQLSRNVANISEHHLAIGRLALSLAFATGLGIQSGTLENIASREPKVFRCNESHNDWVCESQLYSCQKSIYGAMATGDVRVIDLLVHDTMHTQHSPSGVMLCIHHIVH